MKKALIASALVLTLAGCQATKVDADKSNNATNIERMTSVEMFAIDSNIDLPANYKVERNVRRTRAYIEGVTMKNGDQQLDKEFMTAMLTSALSNTGRFVTQRQAGSCEACEEEYAHQLKNAKEQTFEKGEEEAPDFIIRARLELEYGIVKVKEEGKVFDAISFKATLNAFEDQLTSGEVKAYPVIESIIEPKLYSYLKASNKYYGFDKNNPEVMQKAYHEVAKKAIQQLVVFVAEKYQISGSVEGFRGNRFAIDKGTVEGFPESQNVKLPAILYWADGNLTLPLAGGYVVSGDENSSTFTLTNWKMSDPEVLKEKELIEKNGKKYLALNELKVVTVGQPENWKM